MSPVSAYYAFGLLANGAVGASQIELTNLLAKDFEGIEEDNFEEKVVSLLNSDLKAYSEYLKTSIGKSEALSLANRAWFNTLTVAVVPEYETNIENSFSSFSGEPIVVSTDFEPESIAKEINSWAKKATLDMIDGVVTPDDFVPDGDIEPAFALLNALVYQGKWARSGGYTRLQANDSELHQFSNKDGTTKNVDIVSDVTRSYAKVGDLEIISLPLASIRDDEAALVEEGNYTVDVVRVPTGKSNVLSYQVYSSLVRAMKKNAKDQAFQASLKDGAIWFIPVASLKSKIDIKETLEKGFQLSTIFSPQNADFTKMAIPLDISPDAKTFVKFARQDAVLELDEQGIKAAAVTVIGGGVVVTSAPEFGVRFAINSPYFMAIRDTKTDAVLFLAAIDNL
jgi:serpin B